MSLVPTSLSFSSSGNAIQLTWPADHTGWRLQAQTNSLNVGLGTNWTDIPAATSTNKIAVPIGPTNGSVFFRLIYP